MPYTAPLGTQISEPVAQRLRLTRDLTRKPICQLVDDALDQALPPAADLARQISEGASSDNAA